MNAINCLDVKNMLDLAKPKQSQYKTLIFPED